jgi:hypothetical protein
MADDLRALALAAQQSGGDEPWFTPNGGSFEVIGDEDVAFVAACSPSAIIALLDERDRLLAALEDAKGDARDAALLCPHGESYEARCVACNPNRRAAWDAAKGTR